LTAGRVEAVISDLESAIKSAYPQVSRVFIEAQSRKAHRESELRSKSAAAAESE
jgi:hypothetical protein